MRRRFTTHVCVAAVLLAATAMTGRAHSIPTHQNLTKAAVGWLLEAQPRLQCTGTGQDILTRALLVGTEHEDDNYENSQSAARMGRYMFHFMPTLDDAFAVVRLPTIKVGPIDKPLGELDFGVVKTLNDCHSRRWGGFDSTATSVTCSYDVTRTQNLTITNENTWGSALADASRPNPSFGGFSNGFVRLGYLVHLVEDQSSPAHALNASHGYAALPLDALASLDPALKGVSLDLGFPDPMEASADGGAANRDVPRGAWPPRNPSQLMDAAPGEIIQAMHDKVRQMGYRRDSMSVRTARIFNDAIRNVTTNIPALARSLSLPWPLGQETAEQELTRLKKLVAKNIQDEMQNAVKAEARAAIANQRQAETEFAVLGPEAVRLAGSLIWKYIVQAKPVMGTGPNSCTVKP